MADQGCYICEPEQHEHHDSGCMGCDQGCAACELDFIAYYERSLGHRGVPK